MESDSQKTIKAVYSGGFFKESKKSGDNCNMDLWECLAENCPSVLYTKNKKVVNLSCEHNHPNDKRNLLENGLLSKYKCSVKNCNKEAPDVDVNGLKILFLMFPPKSNNIWDYWVNFCNNGPNWEPKATSYICSVSIHLYYVF